MNHFLTLDFTYFFPPIFSICIKISKNSCARYYQEKQRKDIKILLKKKKTKNQQYDRDLHKNLSETEKQKLVEYRKDIMKC